MQIHVDEGLPPTNEGPSYLDTFSQSDNKWVNEIIQDIDAMFVISTSSNRILVQEILPPIPIITLFYKPWLVTKVRRFTRNRGTAEHCNRKIPSLLALREASHKCPFIYPQFKTRQRSKPVQYRINGHFSLCLGWCDVTFVLPVSLLRHAWKDSPLNWKQKLLPMTRMTNLVIGNRLDPDQLHLGGTKREDAAVDEEAEGTF